MGTERIVNQDDIWDLLVSAETYGFKNSILIGALIEMAKPVTREDVTRFCTLTELMKEQGYGEEDIEEWLEELNDLLENHSTWDELKESASLEWSEPIPAGGGLFYDHVVSSTPLGAIRIEWKCWKKYGDYSAQMPWGTCVAGMTLEEAKANVQEAWDKKTLEMAQYASFTAPGAI